MAVKSPLESCNGSSSRFLCAFLSVLVFPSLALASVPLVDFDRMGKVGLAGAFAGLDLFSNSSAPTSFDPSTATLLSRSSDGSLSSLASTNSGGSIVAGCVLDDIFYLAGDFSSIDSVSASNVASYSPSSGAFSALGSNGPNGQVNALFCDTVNKKLWAGGHFTSPASSVAVWDPSSSSWSAPPFGGLSGAASEVLSITTNSSEASIFFAGSFTTSFGNGTSVINGTNNPNVPFSAGATPFSSSLVPVPLQGAQVEASASSSDAGFSNIQNILCPSGPDGPNDTWFAADGNSAVITVRKFSYLSASGIRLGNTFLDGRGTTGFSVTTIPDNTVQNLTFVDPTTGHNSSCTGTCPLLTDSSVPYQDFLFDDSLNITGFQLSLSEWTGAGPGLHILQLLSSGAFASAIDADNSVSCFAPNPSNTTRTGTWTEKDADTAIAGTTQQVLVSDVAVGTPASQGPTFTWMPYVSASGQYDINLLVPGCTNFQDCALRTSVAVTVFPGGGLAPSVTTVSQQNTEDAVRLIYSGPVVPSSETFVTTITMALADQPVGSGQNGQYELVADRVQLVLTSANVSSTAGSAQSTNGTAGAESGFGFFEWPLSSTSTVSATSALPNSSITSLDIVGLDLLQAVGGSSGLSSSAAPFISAVAHHPSGTIFLAGEFSLTSGPASGSSNIVAFSNGALVPLADNGLNGRVSSLVLDGDRLFVGGAFLDTATASTQGQLAGVAVYDVQQKQWSPLQAGVNGAVSSLTLADNSTLLVAGNFTTLRSTGSSQTGQDAAGFAAWNAASSTWINSGGFLAGSMTFVGNGTSSNDDNQYIAGNVAASLKFGASGFVLLQNGADGAPDVTPLAIQLDDDSTVAPSSVSRRRLHSHARRFAASLIPRINVMNMFKRQSTPSLPPLPSPPAASAPAVLAGAFWTNSSSSKELVIIGGNFSFTASGSSAQSQNIAIYDPDTQSLTALQGTQVNGTVRNLLVQGDELLVGGEFTLPGANVNGIAIYNLATQQWDVSDLPPLQPTPGSTVVVRSVSASPSQSNTVVVAGSFVQAGSQPCRAICTLDISTKQWNALGNGIQGDVASVDYAGDNDATIIVAGSVALADNTPANVAAFSIANSTWAAVGSSSDLPGPVTAVGVNDGNSSSIFAAGRSSDGSSSFLYFWNGQQWSSLGSTLQSATEVSQLTMVPLQNTHAANSIIESDRVLLVSGALSDSSFGNASSALFDGQNFIPYIVSTSSSGSPGSVSALIHSFTSFSFTKHHFLATGVVILISIAIAAGIVFLLALIGILWTLFSRKDDKLSKFDVADVDDDDDSSHRPSSLLAHINAATRTTILGGPSPFAQHNLEKEGGADGDQDPFGPDASNYVRAETPSDAIAGTMGAEGPSRPAHARYSFDGAGEGELALTAGQELEVLDDGDQAWWYARDVRTGREGVVPAAYLY